MPRRPTVANRVRIEWHGQAQEHSATGTLRNASETGALLESEERLPDDRCLMFRLEQPIRTDWNLGRVVRYSGSNEVGLRFVGSDAYAFVLAATLGIDLEASLLGLPDELRFSHADD